MWLTGNCGWFAFIADTHNALKGRVVCLQRVKPGSHTGFASAWGLPQLHVRCFFTNETLRVHRAVLCSEALLEGHSQVSWGHFETLFNCPWLPGWAAHLCPAQQLLFGVFEPLLPMLFSLLVVFALQSVPLRLGYLFTHYEYVNLCTPLSLTLCTSVLFYFWKFEWKILNETFS